MEKEIQKYLEDIKANYAAWTSHYGKRELSDVNKEMIQDFNETISFSNGSKYIKVVTNGSVHSFIVATEKDAKFQKGDILKAASSSGPARNFARGNVLSGSYTVQWTGI